MKGMKKKLLAVVAAMTMLCMTLTGCGEELVPADQTIGALFELAAKENAVPMKDLLGFASEEDVKSAFYEEGADTDLVEEFSKEFEDAGMTLSQEDLQYFTDQLYAMLDKVTYTAEITSEEKDAVVVTLKVNGFSEEEMNEVMLEASTKMMESITEEDQLAIMDGDEDLFNTYISQYLRDFSDGLAAMEPSDEAVEITVNCEKLLVEVSGKEKAAWLPTDMDGFSLDIENALIH
ncbi:MAG: hypothetical protein Q4C58_03405 [Eubacteriales bacterium]|nr:hypothetical protein [Eubacteriales bacterium]